MKWYGQLLGLLLVSFIVGCASSGAAVRPSYKGEPKVVSRSSSRASKKTTNESSKHSGKVHKEKQESQKASSIPQKGLSLSEIESKATKYIGTRYKYGGTTSKGFDCSGYVWRVYQDMGYDFSRASSQAYYQRGAKVSRKQARKGDLVFFKERGRINHVGIYLGGDRFIHSSSSRGVIESSLQNSYWKPRIAGFRRFNN